MLAAYITVCCCMMSCINNSEDIESDVPGIPTEYVTREEYSVYTDLLEAMNALDPIIFDVPLIPGKYKLFVIDDHTPGPIPIDDPDMDRTLNYVSMQMSNLEPETLDDLRVKYSKSYLLERQFGFKTDYILLSSEENNSIFRQGGWDEFYRRYPDAPGIMAFSRVGFDRDMDQALVYFDITRHRLAGAGYDILLSKKKGKWKIQNIVCIWVS